MLAKIATSALMGIDAFHVDLEVDFSRQGMPSFTMVGLAEGAVRESKERVFAALKNSGFKLPPARITVNLAPADMRKEGSGYDLPLAMGLLAGLNAARRLLGRAPVPPPPDTAHGALIHHLVDSDPDHFQPSNVNFGLFPPLAGRVRRRDRGRLRAELALARLAAWQHELAEN